MERLSRENKSLLNKLYEKYSLPSGLGSIVKLYKSAKTLNKDIRLKDVKNYLKSKDAYTLHKITKKKFPRRMMIAPKPGVIISCDLADVRELSRYNKGVKYLLVCIDIFSRFAKVLPLKQKNASSLLKGVKKILEGEHFKTVSRLHTDKGGEFYNKLLNNYLKSKNVKLYSVSSYEIKASLAERFLRTLKGKIYRYLTNENTLRYIDVLDKLVASYNISAHRSLPKGQTPEKLHKTVNEEGIKKQFYFMYKNALPQEIKNSSILDVGSNVRISDKLRSSKFHRGFENKIP